MKIKRIYVNQAIMTKGHNMSYDSAQYNLAYVESPSGIVIDETTFVPIHMIREILVEESKPEVKKVSKKEIQ